MKAIPAALQAKIDDGVTSFCFCWKLTLISGAVKTYTSNIDAVTVAAEVYDPGAGLLTTNLKSELGTGIDSSQILGVIDDSTVSAEDLLNGLWDDARIEIFLVDYTAPADGVIWLLTGAVGEIKNDIVAFVAEVRSLLQRAAQQIGYVCSAACKAELGDTACGAIPDSRLAISVTSVADDRSFTAAALIGDGDQVYQFGKLIFTSGINAGADFEVKTFVSASGAIELQESPASPILVGHVFTVFQGCDKLPETCKTKFNNILRFRGEPFIPGTDAVLRVVPS